MLVERLVWGLSDLRFKEQPDSETTAIISRSEVSALKVISCKRRHSRNAALEFSGSAANLAGLLLGCNSLIPKIPCEDEHQAEQLKKNGRGARIL